MDKLKVVKVYKDAKIPCKPKTNTDAGYDIYAYKVTKIFSHSGSNSERCLESEDVNQKLSETDTYELQCNERALIDTGIKATIGEGWELQVRPRSGNALKKGLTVCNTTGTIDPEYRGTIGVILLNTSRKVQTFKLGDAIAQLVPSKIYDLEVEVIDKLDDTIRNSDGYGSTDNKVSDETKDKSEE